MNNDKFLGHNGFLWFVGVVEDRQDPQFAGRVRVRCLGHHTSNTTILPTSDLPWSQVVLPVTSSGISGIGQSPLGLVEGSWVFGYFRDGMNRQEPLVIGSLPGRPSELGDPKKGFYDPNKRLDENGKEIEVSVYPRYSNETDVNRLAVNNPDKEAVSLTTRKRKRITGIPIASFDGLNNIDQTTTWDTITASEVGLMEPDYRGLERYNGKLLNNDADAIEALLYGTGFTDEEWAARELLIRKYSITAETDINALVTSIRNTVRGVIANEATDAEKWDQPIIPYAAVYPYNHVFESESGHVFEIDDTLDNERIYQAHRTGTSFEIDKDGNQVDIIKGDHYNIVSGKRQVVIEGNTDITIGGRHKLYINKDGATDNHYDIQVGPNANINIQIDKGDMNVVLKDGKLNTNVADDYNMKIGGNMNLDVRGNKTETVSGNKQSNTTGTVIHRGSRIDLNP